MLCPMRQTENVCNHWKKINIHHRLTLTQRHGRCNRTMLMCLQNGFKLWEFVFKSTIFLFQFKVYQLGLDVSLFHFWSTKQWYIQHLIKYLCDLLYLYRLAASLFRSKRCWSSSFTSLSSLCLALAGAISSDIKPEIVVTIDCDFVSPKVVACLPLRICSLSTCRTDLMIATGATETDGILCGVGFAKISTELHLGRTRRTFIGRRWDVDCFEVFGLALAFGIASFGLLPLPGSWTLTNLWRSVAGQLWINGSTRGVCKLSSAIEDDLISSSWFRSCVVMVSSKLFVSTARRKVSSNGLTWCRCRSSNRPTSSQLRINRVGVGVWSAVM